MLGLQHDLARVLGAVGGLADRRGDLVEGGGGLLKAGGLLLRAMRQVVRSGGDFPAARGNGVGAVDDRLHRAGELLDGGVEIDLKLAEGLGEIRVEPEVQLLGGEIGEALADPRNGERRGFLRRLARRFGLLALQFQRLEIGGDGEIHVEENRLEHRPDGGAGLLALGRRAPLHHALGPEFGDDRLGQRVRDEGVAADVPAGIEADARMRVADAAHLLHELVVERRGRDRLPVFDLRGLGAGDMRLAGEEAANLRHVAQPIVEEIEGARQFLVEQGLERAQFLPGGGVELHEIKPGRELVLVGCGGRGVRSHGASFTDSGRCDSCATSVAGRRTWGAPPIEPLTQAYGVRKVFLT